MTNRKFWRHKQARQAKQFAARRRVRLGLEELEDRTVPVTVTAGVGITDPIQVAFNAGLPASSVSSSNFQLLNSSHNSVAVNVAYNTATDTVTLTPSVPLNYSST